MNKNSDILIFFDLETGGLDPFNNPILSIGAFATNKKGNASERLKPETLLPYPTEFYSLVKPYPISDIDPEAMTVNNLSLEQCNKAPDEKQVLAEFMDWARDISNCEEVSFCNWALNFDLIFLYTAFYRNNMEYKLPGRKTYDIKSMAKGCGFVFKNLGDLYGQFKNIDPLWQPFEAHNALADAKAAAYIYRKILEKNKT